MFRPIKTAARMMISQRLDFKSGDDFEELRIQFYVCDKDHISISDE